ncbi:MAG: hypothetical protein N0C84_05735 [Candidatus Thiodiazotropha taylori]|uniref:Uncharacterized protein n=1 Tax=Candidatus Thiodiazotropha taylori TaxID=2792791 RepID=A0A9E4N2M2_9GAMM|nr:hypothetical protein [Candidatus Thiodiazotropha taylori]MCW4255954.1 hypothetical protein [Candidatus Thiodiazotropha taylori]
MRKREPAAEALIYNLNALIKFTKEMSGKEPSNRKIAKGRDVSDRMIGKIRKRESIPTVDKLDEIANYFRLPAWSLLLPGKIPPSIILSRDLNTLISCFVNADSSGRAQIITTAKHEASRAEPTESKQSTETPAEGEEADFTELLAGAPTMGNKSEKDNEEDESDESSSQETQESDTRSQKKKSTKKK